MKDKHSSRTGHEGPEGEYRYSSTLFLTSAPCPRRGGVSCHVLATLPTGRDLVPIVVEARWATGAENLIQTRIRFPVCPAHSKLLYQLCYPGPFLIVFQIQFV
jgi:hypothetical protein